MEALGGVRLLDLSDTQVDLKSGRRPRKMAGNTTSPLEPVGHGSLTEQTTNSLIEAILNDSFDSGRLPPEPDLAEMLNVSRTTVRAALQSLERLGMVSRTPGRGTIVLPNVGRQSIALQRLVGFRELLMERHEEVEVRSSYRLEDGLETEAVEALGLGADTRSIRTSKLFVADGKPAIHISDQIPFEFCGEEVQAALIAGRADAMLDSIFSFSRLLPDREINHTVVELVSAVAPENDDTFPLDIAPGTPHLVLQETHLTLLGAPVAHSTVKVDDSFLRFKIVRHM